MMVRIVVDLYMLSTEVTIASIANDDQSFPIGAIIGVAVGGAAVLFVLVAVRTLSPIITDHLIGVDTAFET
jgi:hypothetical protein